MALNPEKDGWHLTPGGRPMRMFDAPGSSRFASEDALYEFIVRQAYKDPDYRELHAQLPWLPADNRVAKTQGWQLWPPSSQGWCIVGTGIRTAEIDALAEQFVKTQAEAGDPLATKALRILIRNRLKG